MNYFGYPYGGFGYYDYSPVSHHGFRPHFFGHHPHGLDYLIPFFLLFPFLGHRGADRNTHKYHAKHKVEKGDTMWKIAEKYNVPLPLLIAANPHIANPNDIHPGETIFIPRLCDMHCHKMFMEPGVNPFFGMHPNMQNMPNMMNMPNMPTRMADFDESPMES